MKEIEGMGQNKLCAIGKIHFYGHSEMITKEKKGAALGEDISTELQRLEIAFECTNEELYEGERSALHEAFHEGARLAVFQGYEADDAVAVASERIFSELRDKRDPYISEMGTQISRMTARLLGLLSREKINSSEILPRPVILVCGNISEEELMAADKNMLLGIFLLSVSPLSKLAVYAHSLGIPLIIGGDEELNDVAEGETAIIDSEKGVLIISPDAHTVEHYGIYLGGIALGREKSGKRGRLICHINDSSGPLGEERIFHRSVLLQIREERSDEELYFLFSSLLDKMEEGELKILLPYGEIRQKEIISASVRASEKGKITLLLPSAADASSVRALKYRLYSELEPELQNISVGAVIESGASALLMEEIGAECDCLAVDSDKLTASLIYPERARANDMSLLDIGHRAFLKAAEALLERAKANGIRLCFFGMTASRDDICKGLILGGAHEIAVPFPYFY